MFTTRDVLSLLVMMTTGNDGGGGSGGSGGGDGGQNGGGSGGSGGGSGGGQGGGTNGGQGGSGGSGSGSNGQDGTNSGSGGSGSGSGGGNGGGSGGSGGGSGDDERRIESLPQWAQTLIRTVRAEARDNRHASNQAGEQLTDLQKRVAREVFGLNPDGTDNLDPEKLKTDLGTAGAEIANLRRENIVLKVATDAGGDPARLADSISFTADLSTVDPKSANARQEIIDKIKAAVQNDRTLAAGSARAPGGNRIGGGQVRDDGGRTGGGVAGGRELRRRRTGAADREQQTT